MPPEAEAPRAERPNQRLRTRKDLLQAANRLLKQGRRPSLDEVAAEALVSRATAYRYFPHVKALLHEAALDVAVPDAEEILRDASAEDVVERVQRVEDALHAMMLANEQALRTLLVQSLERGDGEDAARVPARQNRRTPLLEAALEPARAALRPAAWRRLCSALALVVGTEGMVVCKDVLGLDDDAARRLKRWMIRSLVEAALREGLVER
jgi:AcrR family transcriptional regulator